MVGRTAKFAVLLVAAALSTAALAGCTVSRPVGASHSPQPVITEGVAGDGILYPDDPCSVAAHSDGGNLLQNGTFHAEELAGMHDTGPREGATGTVTLHEDGSLSSYAVASGDEIDSIAERLCAAPLWIDALNSIRRTSWLSGSGHGIRLYPGDTLNLDPRTIGTVGSENGAVYANTPSFTIPR